jgi:UPF0271 protein
MDLNCDMGELEDAALEAALMEFVTSANIACGGHAGDEATMERTARLALARGVRIGAHPGYPDRANFGRIALDLTPGEIERTVLEQIRRLEAVVRKSRAALACAVPLGPALGADVNLRSPARGPAADRRGCPGTMPPPAGGIEHVKPHGALYNVAARDPETTRAIGRAVLAWNPRAILFGLAGSPALEIWREMGLTVAAEAFADRRYEPDGSLRPRKFPDALITDPQEAAAQALRFAHSGAVQTICVHGDTPNAVAILKACREALT